jgi:pimeloyl-ACP methyl ester carboxylesterase
MAARRGGEKSAEQLRGENEQLQARRHHDVCSRLGAIRCPTLVACGRYDGIAPLANGEWIAAHAPGAELRVYEGGHVFFLQDQRALPEVGAFLQG